MVALGAGEIEAATTAAVVAVEAAADLNALRSAEVAATGKQGSLVAFRRELGSLGPEEKRALGEVLHQATERIKQAVADRRQVLEADARRAALAADRLDLTETIAQQVRPPLARGTRHLVSQTRDALEDVFCAMGFTVAEGPEVETDWYNFEALNIPPAHPARGMWDTFYLELGEPETVLLRTHTSPVQVHLMERAVREGSLPIHAVMPGRCFRRDTPDARHLAEFHQVEGLVVDRGVTFSDLAGTIEAFTAAYFGPDIHSRLRPAYFPFTEPSAEFEITCTLCRGEGCRTCSGTGWIELGGCGMVDPAVFAAVGIDPSAWSGFAFGFGIDRCAQMRHQVSDMRALVENDLRFNEQFAD